MCYGTTKTYSVDTNEGGVATPTGTAGSTYSWRIIESNSATIAGNGTNTISINWGTTAAGTYTIEVVETNTSCAAPAVTLSVTIKNNPTILAPNKAVCLGSDMDIQATSIPSNTSDIFSWTTPVAYTGLTNTNTINIIAATAAVAGSYTVTVTDIDGCVSSPATAVLTVNTLPDATVTLPTPTANEFCDGGSVVLTAPTGLSYVWKKDGIIIPTEITVSYTASLTGNYSVTTTDVNSCSNTTNPPIIVTVNPNPTVSVIPSVTQFCDGSNAVLTAIASTGTAPFIYQWKDSSGDITINGTNATYTATATSDYKVKVTDNKGCFVTSTAQSIFNRPKPDASITAVAPTTFCAGESVVLQRGASAILGLTYQWLRDAVDISTATNFDYTATESGSYTVRVMDANFSTNCTTTTTSAILVNKTNLPVTSGITAY